MVSIVPLAEQLYCVLPSALQPATVDSICVAQFESLKRETSKHVELPPQRCTTLKPVQGSCKHTPEGSVCVSHTEGNAHVGPSQFCTVTEGPTGIAVAVGAGGKVGAACVVVGLQGAGVGAWVVVVVVVHLDVVDHGCALTNVMAAAVATTKTYSLGMMMLLE